ncbi:MAG: DNA-binding response regulator [Chloroflexi bacterium HGW-Chloroflexi-4]|jgi:DNA-binding NarL/FixJ family response regulator|nr:MAG: DNA-binding response regulator [Chloroflexi bacterium HGW-Chloroflexi-4]
MRRIRLLVVDDHLVVRAGLRALLTEEADLEVVAEADSSEMALAQIKSLSPDVVILDIQLPGQSGLEACREISKNFPNTKVVILTSYANQSFLQQAIRAGASGYVLKKVGSEELVRAIRAAHNGDNAFDAHTTSQMVARLKQLESQMEQSAFKDLSQREMDVLALVAEGDGNKEIGEKLNLTEITVKNYVSNILSKLELRNRIELATFAVNHHLKDHMD